MERKFKYIKNPEQLQQKLSKVLSEIQELEDPHIITEYKKFFKQHVNIFRRNYVAAYMVKRFIDSNNQIFSPQLKKKEQLDSRRKSAPERRGSSENSNTRGKKLTLKNITGFQTSEKELYNFLSSFEDVPQSDIYNVVLYEKKATVSINPRVLRPLLANLRKNKFKGRKLFISY